MGKPKRVVQLVQSPITNSIVVDMNENEEAMVTGDMNGCVSILFLWNKNDNGEYSNIRGHHAGGDPGNIDWEKLGNGVPEDKSQIGVIMICGKDDYEDNESFDGYKTKVDKKLKELGYTKSVGFIGTNAYIDRKGTVTIIENKLNQELTKPNLFDVRNKDVSAII